MQPTFASSIIFFYLKFTALSLRAWHVHPSALLQRGLNNSINMKPHSRPESDPINQYVHGINCFSSAGLFKVHLWFLDVALLGSHCRSSPLKPYFIGSSIDERPHAWNLSLTMAFGLSSLCRSHRLGLSSLLLCAALTFAKCHAHFTHRINQNYVISDSVA